MPDETTGAEFPALNFNILKRGSAESNPRMRNNPITSKTTVTLYNPDGSVKEVQETCAEERYRARMALRGSRKQRAAQALIPRESVTVVREKTPVAPAVVEAAMAGKEGVDLQIAALEAEVKRLQQWVEEKRAADLKKKQSISNLESFFNRKRLK